MRYIFLSLILFTLAACTKYEKIEDFPIESPRLVANCLFENEKPFVVSVSRSLSVLDNAELSVIDGAKVILYENNIAVDTLKQEFEGDAFYHTTRIPLTGKKYRIDVAKEGYPSVVSTEQELPSNVIYSNIRMIPIDSMYFLEYEGSNDTILHQFNAEISFTIEDLPQPGDLYSFSVYRLDSSSYTINNQRLWQNNVVYGINFSDPALIDNTGLSSTVDYTDICFLSDELFNGQKYVIKFKLDEMYNNLHSYRQYYLVLNTYTLDSFKYKQSLGSDMASASPFDEPRRVFTNIQNGYGIFAGIRRYEIRIR